MRRKEWQIQYSEGSDVRGTKDLTFKATVTSVNYSVGNQVTDKGPQKVIILILLVLY